MQSEKILRLYEILAEAEGIIDELRQYAAENSPKKIELDKHSIYEIVLPDKSIQTRFFNLMRGADIKTVGQLVRQMPPTYFLRCRYAGMKTMLMVQDALKKQFNVVW